MNEYRLRNQRLTDRTSIIQYWKSIAYIVMSLSLDPQLILIESIVIKIDKKYQKGCEVTIVTDGTLESCYILLKYARHHAKLGNQ